MKPNMINVIADLVRQSSTEVELRSEDQDEALRDIECTQPELGHWIDLHDVTYLLSTLALSEKDFGERFPSLSHVSTHDRRRLLATLDQHFEHCTHCYLKRGYDLEMDGRIERACGQHKDSLLRLLDENEADPAEGEHLPLGQLSLVTAPQ